MRAAVVIHCEYAGPPFEAQTSASFTVDSLTRTCEQPNILYVCGEEVLVLSNAPKIILKEAPAPNVYFLQL